MSTRSPMNKRSQAQLRGESTSSSTRRSAASMKPARAAAESVRVVPASSKARRRKAEIGEDLSGLTKEQKKRRKAEIRAEGNKVYRVGDILLKEDPQYLRYRKIWYGIMIAGMVSIVASFALFSLWGTNPADQTMQHVQYVVLFLAYVAIIGAFLFDFIKIRPLRNRTREEAEEMSDSRRNDVIGRDAARQKK